MINDLFVEFDCVETAKVQILGRLKMWQKLVIDAELAIRDEQSFVDGEALEKQLRRAIAETYQQIEPANPKSRAGKKLKRLFSEALLMLSGQIISVPRRQLVYENLVKFRYHLDNAIDAITDFSI